MGAAAAQVAAGLGAEVIVMDVAEVNYPVSQSLTVDLRDRDSVDAALAQIAEPVHAVFSCAGVADWGAVRRRGGAGELPQRRPQRRDVLGALVARVLGACNGIHGAQASPPTSWVPSPSKFLVTTL